MATVADLVVRELRSAGVRTLFGVPGGGGNLDLIAAAGRAGLPFVLTATENGAAIAAVAQAEITGRPGACLTTLGPGVTSVTNGVATAFLERVPVLVFTDGYAEGARYEHQRLDHAALLRPLVKSSSALAPERALDVITRAIRTACDGRPGPAHIQCPGDILAADPRPSSAIRPRSASAIRPPKSAAFEAAEPEAVTPVTLGTAALARFNAAIALARKPLVIAGLGARGATDAASIRQLCERRRVPAMVTYKAKGIVPDDHAWCGGVFTNGAIEQPLIDDSDLLIGVGLDPVELLPRQWTRRTPIIYCGPWAVEAAHLPFAAQYVTGVPEGVRHIESTLLESEWTVERIRQRVEEQRVRLAIPGAGLTAQRVVELAAARLASVAGRVTVDAGAHMLPATLLWPVREPKGLIISNGLSTMGFALPAAIGAAALDRARPVVALTGDGGLLMCAGELLTAAREGLRIIVIVFSDASLSLIEIKQQARSLPPAGVALGEVDWPAWARGAGMEGFAAASEDEFDRALDHAMAGAGPSLIAAKIDRSNYGALVRAVRG